jgi:L-threonylcarbamoyladenylate synthase
MRTETIKISADSPDPEAIAKAASVIRSGGLVAFPTETVYGLGADAANPAAVARVYSAKGRPPDNPLIAHIAKMEDLRAIAESVPEYALALAERFWPGPLTLVAKRRLDAKIHCGGGLDTVAVRLPSCRAALALIEASGSPICAPSANSSTRPSPTRAEHVLRDLGGKIEMVLDGGPVRLGLESTVVDATGERPSLLRPGFVTRAMIESCAGPLALPGDDAGRPPKSPGMKYAHYSPKAQVVLVTGPQDLVAEKILELARGCPKKAAVLATSQTIGRYSGLSALDAGDREDPSSIGAGLFALLREFDEMGAEMVFAEGIEEEGIGEAVMNRLRKASAGRIVEVGIE